MKKAFIMIELIFVIVVMGILAATILPSTRTTLYKKQHPTSLTYKIYTAPSNGR